MHDGISKNFILTYQHKVRDLVKLPPKLELKSQVIQPDILVGQKKKYLEKGKKKSKPNATTETKTFSKS